MKPDEGGAEEAAAGGEVESPADTGLETGTDETPPTDTGDEGGDAGGGGLELASIDKSKLPLILEGLDNNNFEVNLSKGKDKLEEVSKKVDSLLSE